MKLSKAKDIVLNSLVTNEPINVELDMHTKNAALVDLAKDEYIKIIETSVSGSGKIRTFREAGVYPKSVHFIKTGKKFRNQAIWKWIEEALKKYWFIPILITALGIIIKEVVKYFSD